jgi:hypothetical protein
MRVALPYVVVVCLVAGCQRDPSGRREDSGTTEPVHHEATTNAAPGAAMSRGVRWPPPLEASLLTGTWVRQDAPVAGVPSHGLMWLAPDRRWATATVWGSLSKPTKVEGLVQGRAWDVRQFDPAHPVSATALALSGAAGQSDRTGAIAAVGADELILGPVMGTLVTVSRYRRCSPEEERAILDAAGVTP